MTLTIQMVLILVGLAAKVIGLIIAFSANTSSYEKESYILTIFAFASIIYFCITGYRKQDRRYYLATIYTFTASILCKGVAPYETVYATAIYFLVFGLTLIFAERLDRRHDSTMIINVVVFLLIIRTVDSLVIYRGFETTSALQKAFWQFSSVTTLILAVTIAIIHLTRWKYTPVGSRQRRSRETEVQE
jgi:hypothetical protein